MRFASVFLVTSFIVGSIAGPWQPRSGTQCAKSCLEIESFKYVVGKTYVYDYDADSVNSLGEGNGNVRLRIRAKVEITVQSKCDFSMKLLDVSLQNSDFQKEVVGRDEFREALERHLLRFGYQDGGIDNVCPNPDEPVWVLNIKRGILSTFQNTMGILEEAKSLNEVDITGKCPTEYKMSANDSASGVVIEKTKDLSKCSDRTDHYTSIQTNPVFGSHSTFGASTPVVKSSHKCQQVIRNGILQRSNCSEEHAFQPFSRQGSGATTRNVQSLTLLTEQGKEAPDEIKTAHVPVRKSLLFEHVGKDQEGADGAKQEAETALKQLCQAAGHDIRPEVPHLFTTVVHKLQKLDHQQLQTIYENIDDVCGANPVKARKFLLDALSMTGSDAGVTMMRDLILKNEVSDSDARSWFLMLGFVPKPTRAMILSLTTLLDRPSFQVRHPKALLGISALAHSYCKQDAACGSQPEIVDFVNKLAASIGSHCRADTEEDKQKVVVTLKALGNVGHFNDPNVIRVVQRCYRSVDNDVDVRLAAIDAFRRTSCNNQRDDLLGVFFDIKEDSEIRIGSYLAVMTCPTSDLMQQVHRSLELEEVNQVGSFVWTHLTNMNEKSGYRHKYDVAKILSSKKLQKKFSTDFRKFSRYYEGSAHLNALGTGVHLNGEVIFSPKSYLPRSTNLGLGLELFGNKIELFEIGGRAEGFELLVESLFGPKGYFKDDTISKMLDSAREQKSYSQEKMKEIATLFNMKNAKSDDPRGSFYARIFGNDLHYSHFNGLDSLLGTTDTISVLETIARLAQNKETEYTKSVMFMDSSLIIPTSIGLPLNLTVNGTATVNLKVGGNIDLSKLSSKSLDVAINIEPSAAVEISGSMIIDAVVTRSGFRIATTLHTSTYSDAAISVQNGEVVKVHINSPKNQMEIFDIQSKVIVVNGEQESVHEPQEREATIEIERCTGESMSKYLGLQLCGQLQYPLAVTSTDETTASTPSWILAGPYVARLYLQKTDKTLKSYDFEYRWEKQIIESGSGLAVRTGRLLLDTPGSTIDRQLKAEFVHNEVEKSVVIHLISPIKQTSLTGKIVNEDGIKSVDVSWKVDDAEVSTLKGELSTEVTKGNRNYRPTLMILYYGYPIFGLKGYVANQKGQFSTEMNVEHLTSHPITISTVLKSGERKDSSIRYDLDATVDTGILKTYAKGFVQKGNSNVATKLTLEYRERNNRKQSISFSSKFRRAEKSGKIKVWSGASDFLCTLYPTYNWALSFDAQRTAGCGQAESQLTFAYGDKDARQFQKLTLQHKHDFKAAANATSDDVERIHRGASVTKVVFPPAQIDASLELKSELSKNSVNSELTLQYRTDKKINLVLSGSRNGGDTKEKIVRGLAKLTMPTGGAFKVRGDLQLNDQMDVTTSLSGNWMPDNDDKEDTNEAKVILKIKRKSSTQGRELTAQLSLPGQQPLILSADVEHDEQHKAFHCALEVDGQRTYKTHGEYRRPSLTNVQISFGAIAPGRSYSGDLEVDNGQVEKSFKSNLYVGDAPSVYTDVRYRRDDHQTKMSALLHREPLNKYALHLEHQRDSSSKPHASEGRFLFECPQREFGLSWNVTSTSKTPTNYETPESSFDRRGRYEFWWDRNEKVTADVTLKAARTKSDERNADVDVQVRTPFRGLEQLGLRADIKSSDKSWKTDAILFLEKEEVGAVSAEVRESNEDNSRRLQLAVHVETPFQALPTFELDVDHKISKPFKGFSSDVLVKWANDPQQKMLFKILGSIEEGHLTAQVNVSTPFVTAKEVAILGDVLSGDKTLGRLRLAWNEREVDVAAEASGMMTMDKMESYVKVQATTPFQNWPNPSLTIELMANESTVATKVQLGRKVDELASVQLQASASALSVHLKSPLEFLSDVYLNLERSRDDVGNQRHAGHLKINEFQQVFVQIDSTPSLKNDLRLTLEARESSIFGPSSDHQLLVDMRYAKMSTELNSGFSAFWNRAKIVNLSVAAANKGYQMTGSSLLEVPPLESTWLHALSKMAAKFEHDFRSTSTNFEASFNDVRTIVVTHIFRMENQLNFYNDVHVQLPTRDVISDVRLMCNQIFAPSSMSGGRLDHESSLTLDKTRKYSIELQQSVVPSSSGGNSSTSLHVRSPTWHFIVDGSHNVQKRAGQAKVQYLDVLGSQAENEKYVLKTTYDFEHHADRGEGKMDVSVGRLATATLSYEPRSGNFILESAEDKNEKNLYTLIWMDKSSDVHKNLEVNVQTPFHGFRQNTLKVNVVESMKMGSLVLSLDDKIYRIAATRSFGPEMRQGELGIDIETPELKTTASAVYDVRPSSKDNRVSLLVNSRTLGKLDVVVFKTIDDNKNLDAGISLKWSVDDQSRFTGIATVHHDLNDNRLNTFAVDLKKNWPNSESRTIVTTQYNFKQPELNSMIFLNVTSPAFQRLFEKSFTLGVQTVGTTKLILRASRDDDEQHELDVVFSGSKMVVDVTSSAVPSTRFEAEYDVRRTPATAKLMVTVNNVGRASLESSLNNGKNEKDFWVAIATPFEGIKSASIKGSFKQTSFVDAKLSVQKEDQQIEAQLVTTTDEADKGSSLRFTLTTPFVGYTHSEVKVMADRQDQNQENLIRKSYKLHASKEDLQLKLEADVLLGNNDHALRQVTLTANTNLPGYEPLSASVQLPNRADPHELIFGLTLSRGSRFTYMGRIEYQFVRLPYPLIDTSLRLHSDCNGRLITVTLRQKMSQNDVNLQVQGTTTLFSSEAKSFGANVSYEVDLAAQMIKTIKVTLSADKHSASATGSLLRNSDSTEGTFDVTTTLPGYESLSGTTKFETSKDGKSARMLTASLKSNQKVVLDATAKFASNMLDVQLTSAANDGDKVEFKIGHDVTQRQFAAILTKNELEVYSVRANILSPSEVRVKVNSPLTGSLELNGKYEKGVDRVALNGNLVSADKGTLFSLEFHLNPETRTTHLEVTSNLADEHLRVLLDCDLREQSRKLFSVEYARGGSNEHLKLGVSIIKDDSERQVMFTIKSSFTGFEDVKGELSYDRISYSGLSMSMQWAQGKPVELNMQLQPDNSGLAIKLTTPFKDFELINFVAAKNSAKDEPSARHASMKLEWQDKTMELSANLGRQGAGMSISSPFAGFERMSAQLTYDHVTSSRSSLLITINQQTYAITTEADLSARKSSFNVEAKTPLELYVVGGAYDLNQKHAEFRIVLGGDQKKIESSIDLNESVQNGQENQRGLQASLTTPFRQLRDFKLDCVVVRASRNGALRTAKCQTTANDNTYVMIGQLDTASNEFKFEFQLDTPNISPLTLDVAGQASSDKLELKLNVNEKNLAFQTLLQRSGSASDLLIELSSADFNVPTVTIKGKHVGRRESGEDQMTLTVHWNNLNVIQSRLETKNREKFLFEFNSQISPLGHAHAHVHFNRDDHRCTLKTTVDVEKFGKSTFDVDSKHNLPLSLDASVKLTTPLEVLRELSSTATYQMVVPERGLPYERVIGARINLKTPFKYLEWTELYLESDVAASMIGHRAKLQVGGVKYVVTQILDNRVDSVRAGSLVVETPFTNYEKVTLAMKHQLTNGQVDVSLTTPSSETSLVVDIDRRPENYELEANFNSTLIRFGPVGVHAKYAPLIDDASQLEVLVGLKTSKRNHEASFTHRRDANNRNGVAGKLNFLAAGESFPHSLTFNYFLAKPTASKPFYTLSTDHVYRSTSGKKCSSSLKVSLEDRFRSFGAELQAKSDGNNDEHLFAASYALDSTNAFKGEVNIKCSLVAKKSFKANVDVDQQEARAEMTIGDVRNTIVGTYKPSKSSSKSTSYDVQVQLDLPSLSLSDAKLEGKVLSEGDNVVDGEMSIAHRDYTGKVSFRKSADESRFDFQLKRPDALKTMSFSGKLKGKLDPRKVDAKLAITTFDGRPIAIKANWDVDKLNGQLDCFVGEERVFGIQGQFQKTSDSNSNSVVDGRASVHYAGDDHSVETSWKRSSDRSQSTDYEFALKTPIMGIDNVALRSRLANIYGKKFDGSLSLAGPKSVHSFSAKFDRDAKKLKFEGMANSPYLTTRAYTLTGKASRQSSKNVITFTLANPTETHTLQLEASRNLNDAPARLQIKVTTPWLDIGEATWAATVQKLNSKELDVMFSGNGDRHILAIRASKGTNSVVQIHVELSTPALPQDSNPIVADARIQTPSSTQFNINVTATVAGKVHSKVIVHIERDSEGLRGSGQLKTPQMDDLEINGNVNMNNENDDDDKVVNVKGSIKTGSEDEHGFETRIHTNQGGFSGHLQMESNFIPCKKVAISSNYRRMARSVMEGDVAIETPSKHFKVQTNFKQEKGTEGGIILTTPFKSLPLFKINGRLDDTDNVGAVNGFLEFRSTNDADEGNPDLGFYLNYENRTTAALKVRTSLNGYENLEASYHIVTEHDGTDVIQVALGNGRYNYGWESHVLRSTNGPVRKINLLAIWMNQRYYFNGQTKRTHRSLDIESNVDFPGLGFVTDYKLKYHVTDDRMRRTFSSILSGTPLEHAISADIDRKKDGANLDGRIEVNIPETGLRALSTRFTQTRQGDQWRFTLSQLANQQPIVNVQMVNTFKEVSGNGKIQISSPMKYLRSADVYYRFQLNDKQGDATGSMGVNYNGKKLVEFNGKSKDGTKTVEILHLSRPMSIEYTLLRDEGKTIANVGGQFCWDTDRRRESTIGFTARLTTWGSSASGRQLTIKTVHPTRPVNMKFSLERIDDYDYKHEAELAWGDDSPSEAVSYSIDVQGRSSATIRVNFPSRNVEMILERNATARSYLLKWDAGRDETKRIGFRVKHEHLDIPRQGRFERLCELGLSHPKLEKELILRGQLVVDPASDLFFVAQTEFEYSQEVSQKFVAGMRFAKTDVASIAYNLFVRHPASNLNGDMTIQASNNDENMNGGISIIYLASEDGQLKTFQLAAKIYKLQKKIEATMKSQGVTMEAIGQLTATENGYSVHLESRINNQEPYTADLQLEGKDKRMAALDVVYNPDKKSTMMMRSGMPNKKTISLEIFRKTDGVTIEDMKFYVNLNKSRELVTRFNWRPDSFEQIEASLPKLVHNLCSKLNDSVEDIAKYLAADMSVKLNVFAASFLRAVSPMAVELSQEMSKIGQDIQTIQKTFDKLYEDNVFYIRNLYDIVAPLRIGERVCELMYTVVVVIADVGQTIANVVMTSMERLCTICDFMCKNMLPKIGRHIRDAPYAVMHHVNDLGDMSRQAAVHVTLQSIRIFRDVVVYVASVAGQWKGIDTPQWIKHVSKETNEKLQAYLDKFFASKYYVQLKSQFEQLGEAARSVYNHEFWERTRSSYADKITILMDALPINPCVRMAREMAEKLYRIGLWAYQFLDVEGLAREALQVVMVRAEHVAIHTIQEIIVPELNLPDTSRDVQFEPKEGQLEIRQRLPLPWTSFDELPQVLGTPEHEEFERLRENFRHLPAVALKNFKKAWTNEFGGQSGWNLRARALLLGDQHYVTFDGRAFDFSGRCSYLLAKDFVDDRFAVIVNYDPVSATKKSVLIVLDGHRIQIETTAGSSVSIDDQIAQLPTSVGGQSTHISRSGNTLSIRNDDRNVWISYDTAHDVFILEIGGFYHGKTGGLFGNYDHEPFNDLSKSSTQEEFFRAWEVGHEQCPSHENKARHEVIDSYQVQKPCEELFGKYKGLDSCFDKVNPTSYKTMCVNDVSNGKEACSSAAAYVTMCRLQGIHVTLPNACLDCEVNGAKVAQGEETIVEGSNVERSADVVFVVDNTWQCSTTFSNLRTTLATLARNVEGALHGAQVMRNRYGVVGYGGADFRPQVLMAGSSVGSSFVPLSQLDNALNNVNFASGRHHHLSDLIDYAASELSDFRPTVKKLFVVVPCAQADETIEDETYDRLARKIKEMDAILHVISVKEPKIREDGDAKVDTSGILGYDSTTAYTLKSATDQRGVQLLGDDQMRRRMIVDDTRLIALAFNSNGSVFFASRLGNVQPTVARLTNEVFARRIAIRAAPSTCQTCQCTVAGNGLPMAVCTKCSNDDVNDGIFDEKTIVRQSRKKALDEKTNYHKF